MHKRYGCSSLSAFWHREGGTFLFQNVFSYFGANFWKSVSLSNVKVVNVLKKELPKIWSSCQSAIIEFYILVIWKDNGTGHLPKTICLKKPLPHVCPLVGAESHAGFCILGENIKIPRRCRENVPGVVPVICNFLILFVLWLENIGFFAWKLTCFCRSFLTLWILVVSCRENVGFFVWKLGCFSRFFFFCLFHTRKMQDFLPV